VLDGSRPSQVLGVIPCNPALSTHSRHDAFFAERSQTHMWRNHLATPQWDAVWRTLLDIYVEMECLQRFRINKRSIFRWRGDSTPPQGYSESTKIASGYEIRRRDLTIDDDWVYAMVRKEANNLGDRFVDFGTEWTLPGLFFPWEAKCFAVVWPSPFSLISRRKICLHFKGSSDLRESNATHSTSMRMRFGAGR